jgi:hypothetical protein
MCAATKKLISIPKGPIVTAATATGFSPGPSLCFEQRFYHAIPYNVCVLKATYRLLEGKRLKLLEPQPAIVAHDEPEFADREYCSPRYQSDFTPFKPCTDIVIAGTAQPHGGKATHAWMAELAVGNAAMGKTGGMRKVLKLCGPREWQRRALRGWTLSQAQPTTGVRLAYELAYGGYAGSIDKPRDSYKSNPIGIGFAYRDTGTLDTYRAYAANQIEYIDAPLTDIDQPIRAAGFSPLPPYADDRLRYAGSAAKQPKYGMASDMDMRFWNSAPLDQRTAHEKYLQGGEAISLVGLWPEGAVNFVLPTWQAFAVSIDQHRDRTTHPMNLDTVHIDLDKRHVSLRWCVLVPFTLHGANVNEINLIGIPKEMKPSIAPAGTAKLRVRVVA